MQNAMIKVIAKNKSRFLIVEINNKSPPYKEFFLIFSLEPCILLKKTESIKT